MITYKDAGVDVEAGYESVNKFKNDVKRTMRPEVMAEIGGFGGMFAFDKEKYEEPVLVSGTDGVGTKLKIAYLLDKHDTIGIDAVAMCVNDIICNGAEPLFFLDYIGLWKNVPDHVATIVKGVAEGCVQSGCALIGGETAEMPGIYSEGEYDLAGFVVGVVDKKKVINGSNIKSGDQLIGIASSGLHSNGYSLVRRLCYPNNNNVKEYIESFGCTLGEELIKPTRIYVKSILAAKEQFEIKGIANITGGGFIENIPRMIPEGLRAEIQKGSWPVLPVFEMMRNIGKLDDQSIFNTFNMGIGMVLAVDPSVVPQAMEVLAELGEKPYLIGKVKEGEAGVDIC